MIKFKDLLNEIEKPESIYNPGQESEDDFDKKGFRFKKTTIDPATGRSTSEVEYEPDIEKIARSLEGYRNEFKIVSQSNVAEIKELAENIDEALRRVAGAMYKLNKKIEYKKKYK